MIVSFEDYEVAPRFDGTAWTQAQISESASKLGPWTVIDTISLPPEPDPANPQPVSFTTENATLDEGWYLVKFLDVQTNELITDPVFNAAPAAYEILATLSDVNAHLDGKVVEADADNSSLVQVSVARTVKAYLSGVIDAATMATWTNPDSTPDAIREVASLLIASQVYFSETAKSSTVVEARHYAQILYDRAIALLDKIIAGLTVLPGTPVTPLDAMTDLDYFPVDDTDRAFTLGMQL